MSKWLLWRRNLESFLLSIQDMTCSLIISEIRACMEAGKKDFLLMQFCSSARKHSWKPNFQGIFARKTCSYREETTADY